MTNNLKTPAESKKIYFEREAKLLQFLLKEKFSTTEILHELLGYKTISASRRFLHRVASKGFVKQHVLEGFHHNIWGITNAGLIQSQSKQEAITDWQYFEPSKINVHTIDHALDVQKVHLIAIARGFDFTLGREIGSRAKADKIPDAILNVNGKNIAIEVERSIKTKRRYETVIYNYLKKIRDGEIYAIFYVCPTEKKAQQVRKVIHSIDSIVTKIGFQKKRLKLDADKHLNYFEFVAIARVHIAFNFISEEIVSHY